jgi:hypothetical protein
MSLLTRWLGFGQVGLEPEVLTHWVTTTNFMGSLPIPRSRIYLGTTEPLLGTDGTFARQHSLICRVGYVSSDPCLDQMSLRGHEKFVAHTIGLQSCADRLLKRQMDGGNLFSIG